VLLARAAHREIVETIKENISHVQLLNMDAFGHRGNADDMVLAGKPFVQGLSCQKQTANDDRHQRSK
jgi:hypothetical protein